uniref:Permease n=1 Tax=Cyanothece sp. (strain PCC 7425 / ATCC 29141) TaxID=395961 RepID=B8HNP6_CYAP4
MLSVAQSLPSQRAEFIRKTYLHLAGAIAAFIGVEFLLFSSGIARLLTEFVASSRFSWLAILGGFALLGWLSQNLTARADNTQTQYIGLGIYVVAEAIIFAPLLYMAAYFTDANVIPTAAILTLLLFAGLTAVAFITRKDFSFLGGILTIAGFIALGLIVCSVLFGFTLGLLFSVVMVVFAAGAILYGTSNVIHHYSTQQYVAASLELFASVALLFWYILQILMSLSSRR